MPHVTEHTSKVSTRSVKPYACESSWEKRQQDRQTDSQTDRQQTDCPKPLFSTFWGLYIPNPDLSRSRFFARCQYFHWHGSSNNQITLFPGFSFLPKTGVGLPKKTMPHETEHTPTVSTRSSNLIRCVPLQARVPLKGSTDRVQNQ